MTQGHPAHRTHLFASLLALSITGICLGVGLLYCKGLEKRFIYALAPDFSDEKLQGIALQQEAFARPDLMVFYGSSELMKEMPNNATEFFADYPTGFGVFPVGKPGTTSLAVLQKAAATGEAMRGHKLAYSISPGWFFTETFDPKYYEGNFSPLQATEFAFASPLSRELKRDIARRMLEYPKTLERHWVLETALQRLAGDTAWDRALYAAILPLGKLHSAIGRAQDHAEAALNILDREKELNPEPRRSRRIVRWAELFQKAALVANAPAIQAKHNEVARKRVPKASRDRAMVQTIARAKEWTDLELLMRTFQELGATPLFLSMPVEDIRLEVYGASAPTREAYLKRLDELTQTFGFPLRDFREHQKDPDFLVDFLDHLSAEGWLYYNKALDDFFHGRIAKS
jgi:D-alanine transfer protein